MSIQKAQNFLSKVQEDSLFRDKIIIADSKSDLHNILNEHNISFSSGEIEEAFNMLHVACQTEEEAESLKHAYLYYQLLVASFTK